MPTKERTKENCRCFDAADPRLGGCTPPRPPKRKSEGPTAKRTQYYCPFLTPSGLPPLLSRVFPRTPASDNSCSVGAAYMPPATYRSNPFPGNLRTLQASLQAFRPFVGGGIYPSRTASPLAPVPQSASSLRLVLHTPQQILRLHSVQLGQGQQVCGARVGAARFP